MFSAFRQFAERTVSSSSSTGRSRIGSNCCELRCTGASKAASSLPSSCAKTASCSTSIFGRDRTIGLDLDHQLVQVGALLHTSAFDRVAHALDGRERSIEDDAANG